MSARLKLTVAVGAVSVCARTRLCPSKNIHANAERFLTFQIHSIDSVTRSLLSPARLFRL